jgi:hypothetical protein
MATVTLAGNQLLAHPPGDLASVFIRLYDELEAQSVAEEDLESWSADEEVRNQARQVEEVASRTGGVQSPELPDIAGSADPKSIFAMLLGIDQAIFRANPFSPMFEQDALVTLATQYALTGLFNADPEHEGALLPRCAFPGGLTGSRRLAEYFWVQRVPLDVWSSAVRFTRISSRHEEVFSRDEPVRVGCVPLLETYDDVRLAPGATNGRADYRLVPASTQDLRNRIRRTVTALEASGAMIAVLPEASVDDALLEHWQAVLDETASDDTKLRWLLVGSGPVGGGDPPANRAVLLDRRTGTILMTHDKLTRFTFGPGQLRAWHVPGIPPDAKVVEAIVTGTRLSIAESTLGRLSLMICQDVAVSADWYDRFRPIGVSHMLVPIFSKPVMRECWEHRVAERHANDLGIWTVFSNSLVVERATPAHVVPPTGRRRARFTCLAGGPLDVDRRDWGSDMRFAVSEAGDRVARTRSGADGHNEILSVPPAKCYLSWME